MKKEILPAKNAKEREKSGNKFVFFFSRPFAYLAGKYLLSVNNITNQSFNRFTSIFEYPHAVWKLRSSPHLRSQDEPM